MDGRESPGAAGFGESWNGHGQIVPRSILEFLGEGLIVADTGGRINYANEKAAALLGLPAVEIYGQSIVSVLSRLPMMGAGEHNTPSRFEMNGRQIEGRIELIHSLAGELEGTLAVLDDITEAYQLERTRRAMLTAVSHELRSPLTAIKGYVDLLASNLSGDLNHTQRSHLGTIERNVSRMVHLINRLIFMAAGQEDHPEENKIITDLEQVIPQTLQELVPVAERQGIQITTRLADNLRPIQVVPRHFGTILRELVANGIKFSEAGGSIQITAELQEGQAPEDAFVVVQVQDTGIGIEPEDQRHIFDEFVQIDASTDAVKKRAGMGVGLAIVRALIEAYSGRIWLESESGQGSQFTFILPVVQQKEMVVALPAIG